MKTDDQKKRGGGADTDADKHTDKKPGKEHRLEQALEESMDGSDAPSVTQPKSGKD